VLPLGLLPRQCPVCGDRTIIGHGRRLRQAHDDQHERMLVRRGICHPCGKTFTILPDWLAPSGHFSLRCRQQACESIAAGESIEQAAPHCKDPSRSPDPSTLRTGLRNKGDRRCFFTSQDWGEFSYLPINGRGLRRRWIGSLIGAKWR
jgi:hypothetical protein